MKKLLLWCVLVWWCSAGSLGASEIVLSKTEVEQGGFFRVTITNAPPRWVFLVRFQKKNYRTFTSGDRTQMVLIPVGSMEKLGEAEVYFESESELIVPRTVTVVASSVAPERAMPETFIPSEQESKTLGAFLSRTTPFAFFTEDPVFENPFTARSALAVDVIAAESGIVRFAGKLPELGDTVVIDHGQELFSVYARLGDTLVKEADAIPRGFRIGTGNPGKPRFAVRLHGIWIDPRHVRGGTK